MKKERRKKLPQYLNLLRIFFYLFRLVPSNLAKFIHFDPFRCVYFSSSSSCCCSRAEYAKQFWEMLMAKNCNAAVKLPNYSILFIRVSKSITLRQICCHWNMLEQNEMRIWTNERKKKLQFSLSQCGEEIV